MTEVHRKIARTRSRHRLVRSHAGGAGRTRRLAWLLLAVALGGACGGGTGRGGQESPEVSALVDVEVVRSAPLTESVVAYGTVVPAPGSVRAFTAPFEAIVERLHVSRGQRVAARQALVDLSPSPDTKLLIQNAHSAVLSARGRMADARDRLKLGLITRDEVLAQEQALADAEAKWTVYSAWADGLTLRAPAEGVVNRLPVSEGERIPAGDLLVSAVTQGRFEIEVGLEPEDAALVESGLPITAQRLAGAQGFATLTARVRSVSLAVDPSTRLASALAVPDSGAQRLMLGEFVRALIPVRGGAGLVLPRSAVLPQEGGSVVFVVSGGRAFRRQVNVGVETDSLVQVTASDLSAGDTVAVLGNYELTDSMRVRLPGDSTSSGGTRPADPGQG